MAAPMSSQIKTRKEMKENNADQPKSISSQLLYSDTFSECYQESHLSFVGKQTSSIISNSNGPPTITAVPQSSILSRLKDFLPQLSEANKTMASQLVEPSCDIDKFNIEKLSQDDQPHIEMNLALLPPEMLEDTDDDSSSEDDSSDSEDNEEAPEVNLKFKKEQVKRKKVNIEEVIPQTEATPDT
ncbi:NOP protein chaperone 1-like [Physella acuta]|uniref:NOP protein chaperone 1-like n=1 Tax=Physella acuta TaxID=109671 RepID=UPI0027DC2F09|nr:NOP protein chaperone 1-like [Physella acuta]